MTGYIDNPVTPTTERARADIGQGRKWPYDNPVEEWGERGGVLAETWEVAAARGIINNLLDRRGIKQELARDRIDLDVRQEIVAAIAMIIVTAHLDSMSPTPEAY